MKLIPIFILLFLMSCKSIETVPTKPEPRDPTAPPVDRPVKSWALQYNDPLVVKKRDYFVLDLYGYSKQDIQKLKANGTKVFCYFSSQYENYRPDSADFKPEDLGRNLDSWPGEKWINPKSANVRTIMLKRVTYAKSQGCDGIDLDNIDFYTFKTGFDNSKEAAIDYVKYICNEVHKQGMLFNQKNALDMIADLKDCADTYQNESCQVYNECDYYNQVDKPIFHIEYKPCKKMDGFYSVQKDQQRMAAEETECQ